MIFQNRHQAGRALARVLQQNLLPQEAIVLALPRGGVPVGYEVARLLERPLDVLIVRKLGVPGQEELAFGAVARGGIVVLNPSVVQAFALRQSEIDRIAAREREEIERRESLYRGDRPPLPVEGRPLVLVDDGLATGATMTAAVRALRSHAASVVVAVPVGSQSACEDLKREADAVVCLSAPEPFEAVGEFYRDFRQISDEEVSALVAAIRARDAAT